MKSPNKNADTSSKVNPELSNVGVGVDMLLQAAQSSESPNGQTSPVALEPDLHNQDTNKKGHRQLEMQEDRTLNESNSRMNHHGLSLPGLHECGLLVRTAPPPPPTKQNFSVPSSRISIPALLNNLFPVGSQVDDQGCILQNRFIVASPPPPASLVSRYTTSLPESPAVSERRYSPLSASRRSPHSSSAGVFACSHVGCTKSFPSRSRLQRHIIVHSKEKPFACTFEGCGRRFSRRDNMLQHFKSHQRNRD